MTKEQSPAERIKDARTALGMSQSQFAKALGLRRPQTVSNWERGEKNPRETIFKLIEALLKNSG